jgi:hypothetical protein
LGVQYENSRPLGLAVEAARLGAHAGRDCLGRGQGGHRLNKPLYEPSQFATGSWSLAHASFPHATMVSGIFPRRRQVRPAIEAGLLLPALHCDLRRACRNRLVLRRVFKLMLINRPHSVSCAALAMSRFARRTLSIEIDQEDDRRTCKVRRNSGTALYRTFMPDSVAMLRPIKTYPGSLGVDGTL